MTSIYKDVEYYWRSPITTTKIPEQSCLQVAAQGLATKLEKVVNKQAALYTYCAQSGKLVVSSQQLRAAVMMSQDGSITCDLRHKTRSWVCIATVSEPDDIYDIILPHMKELSSCLISAISGISAARVDSVKFRYAGMVIEVNYNQLVSHREE